LRAQKLLLSRPLRSLDLSLSLDSPDEGCGLAPEPSLSLGTPLRVCEAPGSRRASVEEPVQGPRRAASGERLAIAIARRSISLPPERLAAKEDTVVGTPMTRERSRSLFEFEFQQ